MDQFLCAACGEPFSANFPFSNNSPEPPKKHIPGYDFWVHPKCWRSCEYGWPRHCKERIRKHLQDRGITEPKINSMGLLPREYP